MHDTFDQQIFLPAMCYAFVPGFCFLLINLRRMQTIPSEHLQAFLTEARASGVYEMYYIELATGLRRGELLGLKWGDIEWKNGIIKVKRQIARVDDKVVEAP